MIQCRSVAGLALLMLAGCVSTGSVIEDRLDPVTAITITYCRTPMIFSSDDGGRAAFARKYIHMGPVEINRMGSLRYYLWVGIWNTVRGPETGKARDGFEAIVIFADGEPLPLEVTGWTAESIGASEAVYLQPVSSSADAYYEVTVEHLRLIATSKVVRIQSTGNRPQSYELWDEQKSARASLYRFLDNAAF